MAETTEYTDELKYYVTPEKLGIFLNNSKELFTTKEETETVKTSIPTIQFVTWEDGD